MIYSGEVKDGGVRQASYTRPRGSGERVPKIVVEVVVPDP